MEFNTSEHKHGLFAVMAESVTPADKGGILVMRLLTNKADSKKVLAAANDLLAALPNIPANTKLDVTVGKPQADINAVEGTDEADTKLRYRVSVKQLERRARAIVELFASDVEAEILQPGHEGSLRKQGKGLASGLTK